MMRGMLLLLAIEVFGCSGNAGSRESTNGSRMSGCSPCRDPEPIYIYENKGETDSVKAPSPLHTDGRIRLIIVNNAQDLTYLPTDYDCRNIHFRIKGVNDEEEAIGSSFGYGGLTEQKTEPVLRHGYGLVLDLDLRKGVYCELQDLPAGRYEVTVFIGWQEVEGTIDVVFEPSDSNPFVKPYDCEAVDQKRQIIKVAP